MPGPLQIVVISLANSSRRARLIPALEAVGLPWSFFDANTKPTDRPYCPQRALEIWGRPLTAGEIGAAASHLEVIAACTKGPADSWTLVLEDDVFLDPLFDYRKVIAMCDDLGLDYLRLYARAIAPMRHIAWLDQRQLVRFRRSPMGSQAYLISGRGAALASPQMPRIDRPIDWELDRFWHNGLPMYALFPFPAIELMSPSTVSKFPNDPLQPSAAQKVLRIGNRARDYLRRAGANGRLLARDATLKRRLAVVDWAF